MPPSDTPSKHRIRIVVVGGGATGLELVRRLDARFGRRRHDIVDRTQVWKPLLHEIATGALDGLDRAARTLPSPPSKTSAAESSAAPSAQARWGGGGFIH